MPAPASYTLKRTRTDAEDATKSLEAWAISSAQLRLISLELDTLDLLQTKTLSTEDDFQTGDILRLYRDGTQVFMGRVLKPAASAGHDTQQRKTLVAGPWWYAEQATVTQSWLGGPDLQEINVSWATFFLQRNGERKEIGVELINLVNTLIGLRAPWSLGTMDARGTPPPQKLENVTFAEAIKAVIEPIPDIVAWFDYTEESPAFHLRDPDHLTPLTLAIGADVITDLEVARHDDDQVPSVTIQLVTKSPINLVDATTGEVSTGYRNDYTDYTVGDSSNPFGAVRVTWPRTDPMDSWNPIQFAQRCYDAFRGLLWRGSLTLKGKDYDTRLRPGIRLNLTGGRTEWATMDGVVQQVQHDLFSGETQATFGPPLQLGPSDLLQRLINLRRIRRATADDQRAQDSGYTASFDEDEDEDLAPNGAVKIVAAVERGNTWENMVVRLPRKTQVSPPPV